MSTDLFACPFCGQDDLLHTDRDSDSWEGNTHYVRCIRCDVRMMGETEQDAMKKWNFRANTEVRGERSEFSAPAGSRSFLAPRK